MRGSVLGGGGLGRGLEAGLRSSIKKVCKMVCNDHLTIKSKFYEHILSMGEF